MSDNPTAREAIFAGLVETVQGYASLPKNWDTYGGEPACKKAITFAESLLLKVLQSPRIPHPFPSPIGHGVNLCWSSCFGRLYFETDDGSVLAVAEVGERTIGEYVDPSYSVERAVRFIEDFFMTDFPDDDDPTAQELARNVAAFVESDNPRQCYCSCGKCHQATAEGSSSPHCDRCGAETPRTSNRP